MRARSPVAPKSTSPSARVITHSCLAIASGEALGSRSFGVTISRTNRRSRAIGSEATRSRRRRSGDPDQAVGLGVSAAPPALGQVGTDLPGGGSVELAIDVGLDLRAQSKLTEMIHLLGTCGRSLVIPGARMEYRGVASGFLIA